MNRTDSPAKQPKPFGVNGPREPILATTPSGDNTASYDVGFPPITMTLKSAGGLPPKGQDMNQILYELSALCRWGSAGALNTYDSAFSSSIGGYPSGALVISNDLTKIYVNTTDANLTNPNSGGAGWKNLLTYLNLDNVVKVGDFGLGIKNEAVSGGMASLSVTKFDYFNPSDNIGPLPGTWTGGVSYAMGNDIGWQLAGLGQASVGSKPRFFVRCKYQDATFSQWGEVYHSLNKPTATDLGLGTASGRNVGTGANQIPDMSSFTTGSGSNGWWRKGPDGVIEQYGLISNMSSTGITPSFPIAFPSEMRSFTVGVTGNSGVNNYPIVTVALNPSTGTKLTHFTVTGYNTSVSGTTQLANVVFYYHAIGI
ncbi:gp53-like domain-containing protein [Enterobacter roggenkampii]|uniref:gp53-like domain-containing protein n=1 Tax=Enterobacter roggenkampii TaxID=1812935 RepID=UPI0032AF33FB